MASEIKSDKLSPSTGTALQIGDASDTITIPTGATFTITDGLGVAGGGTGLTSFTAGDVLYATGTTTLAKLAKGTAEQVLAMNAGATAPDWGSVDLTVLPTISVAKGGTGQAGGFTEGDILYATDATTLAKLAKGTAADLLTMNAGATAPEWAAAASAGFTMSAVTATTSGTDIAFTSIPAGTKVIYINFNRVSLSGTDEFLIQLGDSGGMETTGYYNYSGNVYDNVLLVAANSTAGLWLDGQSADYGLNGTVTCTLVDGTNHIWSMTAWTCSVAIGGDDTTQYLRVGQCQKDLSAELDRLNIGTNGSDTFDNGAISLLYI